MSQPPEKNAFVTGFSNPLQNFKRTGSLVSPTCDCVTQILLSQICVQDVKFEWLCINTHKHTHKNLPQSEMLQWRTRALRRGNRRVARRRRRRRCAGQWTHRLQTPPHSRWKLSRDSPSKGKVYSNLHCLTWHFACIGTKRALFYGLLTWESGILASSDIQVYEIVQIFEQRQKLVNLHITATQRHTVKWHSILYFVRLRHWDLALWQKAIQVSRDKYPSKYITAECVFLWEASRSYGELRARWWLHSRAKSGIQRHNEQWFHWRDGFKGNVQVCWHTVMILDLPTPRNTDFDRSFCALQTHRGKFIPTKETDNETSTQRLQRVSTEQTRSSQQNSTLTLRKNSSQNYEVPTTNTWIYHVSGQPLSTEFCWPFALVLMQ